MKYVLKIILSACAVFVVSKLLPGIEIESYITALWVAVILGFLNTIVRPIFIVLTIPITLITLGLFLLVVNAIMILLADFFVSGFMVNHIGYAILFSLVLSVVQSVLNKLIKIDKKKN